MAGGPNFDDAAREPDTTDSVDRAHLDRLGARFGAAFVRQLIDVFISEGSSRIGAAKAALDAGDVAAVASAAHALKSSAGNLGAHALMSCAAGIERIGRVGIDSAELPPLVEDLTRAFEQARRVLLQVRADMSA